MDARWPITARKSASQPWAPLRSRLGQDFADQWSQSQPPNKHVHSWTLVFMSEETLPHCMAITPQRMELAKGP